MIKPVDLLVIGFGALVIVSAFHGRTTKATESFSSNTMSCIKGIFAIMIVLFHLSQHISGGLLFRMLTATGYLSVAVFFFISGYGLYTRTLQTQGEYCKNFLTHRIPKALLPWMIATVLYALYWFTAGGMKRIIQICNNRENGCLLITNSWFVIAIAIFYLIFYFSFINCKENYRLGIILSFIGISIYIVIAYALGLGGWWFYSSYSFILGIVWKENEIRINSIVERRYVICLLGWIGIFASGYALRLLNGKTLSSPAIYDIALLIASAAFAGIVFTLVKKISVNNQIWTFLGKISFEIYLLHELVYNFLRNEDNGLFIRSDVLYASMVVVLSVFCAYIFNIVVTKQIVTKVVR